MRPNVHLSYAQSLDGRIATITGDSHYISSPETLLLAHQIRSENDAILVGIGTVLADNPRLNCRLPEGCPRQPVRIILDSSLRLPIDSLIAQTANEQATLVIHGTPVGVQQDSFESRISQLHQSGIRTMRIDTCSQGGLNLTQLMEELWREGIKSIFVEGGSGVLTSFIKSTLFDLLTVVTAPILIGKGVQAIGDLGVRNLKDTIRLETVWIEKYGPDIAWRLRPLRSA